MGAEVATAALRRGALLFGAALAVAGCGSMPSQDENEPSGEFPVRVDASFPEQQKLAKDSRMEIKVSNAGEREIPNVNVTVRGFDRTLRDPYDPERIDPGVADPERPVFIVDQSPVEFFRNRLPANASLVDREVNPPAGDDRRGTSYVDTYSLGALPPGETAVFRWDLSAVYAGPYEIAYKVNAGLDGDAVAVGENGQPISGTFEGTVEDTSPAAKVDAGDGETIITSDGRRIEDQRGVIADE